MTGLTSTICKNAATYTTGKLLDSGSGRGNKSYWVTKFKDGNCWMTQNLDYDDPNSTKVTGTTPSGWTSTAASYRAYYDPGNSVITEPTLKAINSEPDAWTPTDNENFITTTQYVGTDAQTICTKTANTLAAPVSSPSQCKIYSSAYYDKNAPEHAYAGNYYSFQSATNGTGSSTSSVCPSGWKIPISNTTASGSFGGLVNAEGITNDSNGWIKIQSAPYYFAAGGGVWSGGLQGAGGEGWYWSSTASSSASAYVLYFASSSVYPSNTNARHAGQPVRCLVQGS